jgi:predicted RNase H-like HicB family nuclease
VKQDGDWWFGWVEEVPGVNAQAPTREALLVSLNEVLREALEMNRTEACLTTIR